MIRLGQPCIGLVCDFIHFGPCSSNPEPFQCLGGLGIDHIPLQKNWAEVTSAYCILFSWNREHAP